MENNRFVHDIKFNGVNFPSDGPVMKKATQGWEPSTEKMYGSDGVLKGAVSQWLSKLEIITCVTIKPHTSEQQISDILKP